MRILLGLLAVVLVSGCSVFNPAGSDEFGCPGMPKGITCKSPREVYNLTDHEKRGKGKGSAPDMPTYVFASEPDKRGLNPVPVLEQAQVLRVWIAPWVDKNNDLHWPGVMFTELKKSEWHFGDQEFEGVEPPVPHKMFDGAPPAAMPPSANKPPVSADMPKEDVSPNLN